MILDRVFRLLNRLSERELRICAKEIRKLLPRGRPKGSSSRNPVTQQSALAAQHVRRLRYQYMKENGVYRLRATITDQFIDRAMKKYPRARESIVREHLRKSATYRE